MHTVDQLEAVLGVARQLGYVIRQEWLDGNGGGACELAGKKHLFVDLSLSTAEQLDQTADAIRTDPGIYSLTLNFPLQRLFGIRRSA